MPKDNIARGLALKNQKDIKQIETNSYNPSNKTELNKIGESEEGKLKYNGEIVGGTVDISGKADKVTGATSGNFPALDENGNLTDSGISPEDVGGGSVTVVDYFSDLPDDAAEGELAYVRLETESGDGSPVDLSDCPKGSNVSAEIEAAYTARGGTLHDSGWYDFEQSYTNCNFSAGSLKLGTPVYRPDADIDAYFYSALELGNNYGEDRLLSVRPILFLVSTDSEVLLSERTVFVPDNAYSYEYMSGCVSMGGEAVPKELVEDGVTKYIIKVATLYAFENLSGQLYNTDGMFDGLQINLARGWNSVALVMTEEFLPERAEVQPVNDVYLPEYAFWVLAKTDGEDEEIFARATIPEMITDTTQSTIIPPALYIRADGEWRKTS